MTSRPFIIPDIEAFEERADQYWEVLADYVINKRFK